MTWLLFNSWKKLVSDYLISSLWGSTFGSSSVPATPTQGGSKLSPGNIFKNLFKCVLEVYSSPDRFVPDLDFYILCEKLFLHAHFTFAWVLDFSNSDYFDQIFYQRPVDLEYHQWNHHYKLIPASAFYYFSVSGWFKFQHFCITALCVIFGFLLLHYINVAGIMRHVLNSRSFVPPVRDEESETQRKAHAKRVRETRRSTQGVTLEEIKSAEQLVRKKHQQTTDTTSGSSQVSCNLLL